MSSLSLKHVNKTYSGGMSALVNFSLDVGDDEIVALTGPAGCGKSAVLRILSGLDEPDSGEVYIDFSLALGMPAKERDLLLITTEHPVYNNKTSVFDALGYGLKIRKISPEEIASRVESSAAFMNIEHLLQSKVCDLKLADVRRVALCRAAVRRPKAVLIDNILDGLEGADRIGLINDVIKLKNLLSVAFVFTTPDSSDAMTLGTRIAVMKDGVLRQFDTPQWMYDNPADTFVAAFLGTPQMNMMKGKLIRREGKLCIEAGSRVLPLTGTRSKRLFGLDGGDREVVMGVRAEDIHAEQLFIEASPETVIEPEVRIVERLGGENILYMRHVGKQDYLVARTDARTDIAVGEKIKLAIDINRVQFFDAVTGKNLASLPSLNMLPCVLVAGSDGTLSIRIGEAEQPIPPSVTERLADRSVIGGQIRLAVPPDGLCFEPFAGSVGIDAEVEFTVEYPKFTAVYMHMKDEPCRMVATAPREMNVSAGEKVSVYVSPEKQLLCRENGERLIVSRPISSNTATALVKTNGSGAVATVGKNKFRLTGVDWKDGAAKLRLPPKAIALGKGENTVSALVLERDFTGICTLLYLKVDGFEPYLTAAVDGAAAVSIGDKIKINIDPSSITADIPEPLIDYIRDVASKTPAHVHVTPEE